MTIARTLENCPPVVYIVYTPGPGAEQRGYEQWLREVDNPFFNAIPDIRHYANWQIERTDLGGPLEYDYFDFLGLESAAALERVWFNADLDRFRHEWVRLWDYTRPVPLPVHAHAFRLRQIHAGGGESRGVARLTGGRGAPPSDADLCWQIDDVVRKHFARAGTGSWHWPAAENNPLGLDWLALRYGDAEPAIAPETGATVAFTARLLAAPA